MKKTILTTFAIAFAMGVFGVISKSHAEPECYTTCKCIDGLGWSGQYHWQGDTLDQCKAEAEDECINEGSVNSSSGCAAESTYILR